MFNSTVASICDETTKKLEKVQAQQEVKLEAAEVKEDALKEQLATVQRAKAGVITESTRAANAIIAYKKIFGVDASEI